MTDKYQALRDLLARVNGEDTDDCFNAYIKWCNTFDIEHCKALLAERDQYARILDGLPQDAIDGGWTAKGISAHTKRLEVERDALREALNVICEWKPPDVLSQGEIVPMAIAIGSNGERDYFRGIARAALSQ